MQNLPRMPPRGDVAEALELDRARVEAVRIERDGVPRLQFPAPGMAAVAQRFDEIGVAIGPAAIVRRCMPRAGKIQWSPSSRQAGGSRIHASPIRATNAGASISTDFLNVRWMLIEA
jgi:hypothetical protein